MRRFGILVVGGLAAVALIVSGHHTREGSANLYPDPQETPGAINIQVQQNNIQDTICKPGWTATIRPSSSYTNTLKRTQLMKLAQDGHVAFPVDSSKYEEDHLISLELGGHPTDPKNLWPEAYPEAREKDRTENFLHLEVCAGVISLKDAQTAIVGDWYAIYTGKLGPRDAPESETDD